MSDVHVTCKGPFTHLARRMEGRHHSIELNTSLVGVDAALLTAT